MRVDIRKAQLGFSARASSLTPEELWSAIEKDPRWPDWQEGRMSARDWHLNLCQRLGISLEFRAIQEVWNSALDPRSNPSGQPVRAARPNPIVSGCFPTPIPFTSAQLEVHVQFLSAIFRSPRGSTPVPWVPASQTRSFSGKLCEPVRSRRTRQSTSTISPHMSRPRALVGLCGHPVSVARATLPRTLRALGVTVG